ncbi:MAG: tRNA (adenosine(37)-N6)-threonylcarbamoyltransferase complex dimerization subunit type 1 TsaB [Nitrospinales bacterium]
MRILSIDSSSPSGSIALLENHRITAQTTLKKTSTFSNSLLSLIDEVLVEARRELSAVEGFCLTTGPGSFTGLRVGVSLVKGFVLSTQKPFVGVNTLEALAALVEPAGYRICPLLDARKKEVYSAFFKYDGAQLKRQSSDCVLPPQVLVEKITEPTIFIGPGLESYGKYLSQSLGPMFVKTARIKNYSTAASAGLIAYARFDTDRNADLDSLNIHYLRKPEAELKLTQGTL